MLEKILEAADKAEEHAQKKADEIANDISQKADEIAEHVDTLKEMAPTTVDEVLVAEEILRKS